MLSHPVDHVFLSKQSKINFSDGKCTSNHNQFIQLEQLKSWGKNNIAYPIQNPFRCETPTIERQLGQ